MTVVNMQRVHRMVLHTLANVMDYSLETELTVMVSHKLLSIVHVVHDPLFCYYPGSFLSLNSYYDVLLMEDNALLTPVQFHSTNCWTGCCLRAAG